MTEIVIVETQPQFITAVERAVNTVVVNDFTSMATVVERVREVVEVVTKGPKGDPGLVISTGTNKEVPTGPLNGVNMYFGVSQSYVPHSTQVFLNGLILQEGEDYVETNPTVGEIAMGYAPSAEDTMIIVYLRGA